MEQQEQGQERNLPATPKRRRDAAKRGTVLRSRELHTLLVTLGGAITLLAVGPRMLSQLKDYALDAFETAAASAKLGTGEVISIMILARDRGLQILAPIFITLTLLALLGPLLTGGIAIRWSSIAPKFSNLSLLKGFKRMFSARALMELLKVLLKFSLLVSVSMLLFYFIAPQWLNLGQLPLEIALIEGARMLLWFLVTLSATLVLIAAVDLPFQFFQYIKRLRMTRQELQEELKETEGRPEVKRRIRTLQFQAAQRRLEASIPKAAVVITNPMHFAVALRYDDEVATPMVVARGAGALALHMQTLARRHAIPIVAAPPLARALYFTVQEGRAIPLDLYRAVAQVMIYVLQLGDQPQLRPPVIHETDIPSHRRRGGIA